MRKNGRKSSSSVITKATLFGLLVFPPVERCWAQDDPSTIIVPYSSSGDRTLGDGVSIEFPYDPLGRCVKYASTDVVWDTTGAISSEGKLEVLQLDDSSKRDTELSLGYQTSAKIKSGTLTANSSFSFDGSDEQFRADSSRVVTVSFTASADYGRRMIQDYALDPRAPSPTTDLSNFRARCGSHFIRGEKRMSTLRVFINIRTSSAEGKDSLTAALKQTIGGGMSLSSLSSEGSATLTAKYKNIIEFASKSDNLTVDYFALGGPGISAAGEVAKATSASDLSHLGDIVSNVSSLFTQDNSGIVGYMLQPNTALGAPDVTVDLDRVERIGGLTKQLIMLTDALHRYDSVKTRDATVFEAYFENYWNAANVARAAVVAQINKCASGGDCSSPATDLIEKFIYPEDMFKAVSLTISCSYQKASDLLSISPPPPNDPNVLESISIDLHGLAHNKKLIDFQSLAISRLDSENQVSDVTSGFSGFSWSAPDAKNEQRAFGTIYSENLRPKSMVSYSVDAKQFTIDMDALGKARDRVLGSTFALYAPGPTGAKASYDTGYPPRNNCLLTN